MLFEAHGSQILHYEDFQVDGEDDFFEHFSVGDGANPLAILEDAGFRVLRFWNVDVDANMDGVIHAVTEALQTPPPGAPRHPPRRGGGIKE